MNTGKLAAELANHPDGVYRDYLLDGFINGFDTLISVTDLPTKECKNLLSARDDPQTVSELIASEVSKGYLVGPFADPPFSQYRVSPIGIAKGKYSKKTRLIVDLSSPHNSPTHNSINSLIDKDECSLSYVSIDDAVRQIRKQGKGAQLCKVDISDAFKIVPIKQSQYHLFCIKWEHKYYYYQTLSFGCRSSPKIFDQFSSVICWIADHNYDIDFILHLLDDFLTIDSPLADGQQTMATLLHIFHNLNVPIAKHKTQGPCTVLEYLGIILDSWKLEARLPTDKVHRIKDILHSFRCRKTCTKRELLQLLGHLNFAARVIPPGRSFVSYLLSLSASVTELHHHVHLNVGCREDIAMWWLFLDNWNGVSMFHDSSMTHAQDINLFTDASSTVGYAGFYEGLWFAEKWPEHLPCKEDTQVSMAFRELYPIVVSAMLWGHMWKRKRIVFHCDNLGTVQIIQKGRSKVPSIMLLMRKLTWCAAVYNFCVYAKHVPGVLNTIADALSRFQMDKFRKLVPRASQDPCPCPSLETVLWNFDRMQEGLW